MIDLLMPALLIMLGISMIIEGKRLQRLNEPRSRDHRRGKRLLVGAVFCGAVT